MYVPNWLLQKIKKALFLTNDLAQLEHLLLLSMNISFFNTGRRYVPILYFNVLLESKLLGTIEHLKCAFKIYSNPTSILIHKNRFEYEAVRICLFKTIYSNLNTSSLDGDIRKLNPKINLAFKALFPNLLFK